jgi:hypothetical protein
MWVIICVFSDTLNNFLYFTSILSIIISKKIEMQKLALFVGAFIALTIGGVLVFISQSDRVTRS